MEDAKGLKGGGAREGSEDRNLRRRGKKGKINDGRKEKSDGGRYKCYGEGENTIILERKEDKKEYMNTDRRDVEGGLS
jgi:hypothetical protein